MSAPARVGVLSNVAGAVLVGGASTRMGGPNKALIEVDGVALATRTARLLWLLCEDVLVVGAEPPPGAPGRAVADPGDSEAPRCALRGLVAALGAATADRVLVVATDMPNLSLDLLLALIAWPEHDSVVVRDAQGQLHPLCGIHRRAPVLEVARAKLDAGDYALRGVLDAVDCDVLCGADLAAVDPTGRALTNVNTPEELSAALSGR
jgi:molybdopterin-guanine dinucleotide biosynthesis protein A